MARASMHTMVVWTMFPVSFFHGSLSIIICKVASNLDSGRHCFLLGYGKKKLLGMRLSFDFSVSDRWILGLFIYEALGFWQQKKGGGGGVGACSDLVNKTLAECSDGSYSNRLYWIYST